MSVPDCPWFGRWQENLPPMKWTHCLKNTLHVMELLNDLSEELSLTSDIVNSLPINPLSSVIVCSCLSPVCDSDCESEFQWILYLVVVYEDSYSLLSSLTEVKQMMVFVRNWKFQYVKWFWWCQCMNTCEYLHSLPISGLWWSPDGFFYMQWVSEGSRMAWDLPPPGRQFLI